MNEALIKVIEGLQSELAHAKRKADELTKCMLALAQANERIDALRALRARAEGFEQAVVPLAFNLIRGRRKQTSAEELLAVLKRAHWCVTCEANPCQCEESEDY